MAESVTSTSKPRVGKASRNETLGQAPAEVGRGPVAGKGKKILVLDDDGRFSVTDRKTGVGVSIKRLAVRLAVLFSSKDRAHWNDVLGLKQDSRAAKAAEQFSKRLVDTNAQESAPTKKNNSYLVISEQELVKELATHNKCYRTQFLAQELGGVLDDMQVSQDHELRDSAKALAQIIVENAELGSNDKLFSRDDVVLVLGNFRSILVSSEVCDLNRYRQDFLAVAVENLEKCTQMPVNTNEMPITQAKLLHGVLAKIRLFLDRAIYQVDPKDFCSLQFCCLQLKQLLEGRAGLGFTKETGRDFATKFMDIDRASQASPQHYYIKNKFASTNRMNVCYYALSTACVAVC